MRALFVAAGCLLVCCGTRSVTPGGSPARGSFRACALHAPEASLLEAESLSEDWTLLENPRAYAGEELFDLIDGGAAQYLDHGFQWALAATYLNGLGQRMSVEIYRMASPSQARNLFDVRDFPAERPKVGDDARYQAGMVEFLTGCCIVTVTSFSAGDDSLRVIAMARHLDTRLRQ